MVIDIDYEATKNNDGNDIVDIYVCTSDAQFLHSTIHDVPSGDVEEKTIGDIRYMRVSLKVPKIKRENKNVRLIFKLFLEDDAITDLQILLDSNVLKTSNYVQDYYVIKSSEYGLKLSLSYKNYYVVTKCLDQEIEEVIIPSEYKGMPVKEIYDGAFKDCMLLKNIIIPDSVEVIGSHAFDNCMSLVSITLPKNLEEIESWAFANCKSLNDIVFSKNLKKIDYQAFEGCDELNLLEYDNALYLGDSDNPYLILIKAISTDIDNCIINENCKFIYDEAFYECKNLASIEFPDSVIGIGSRVIYGCKELNDNNIVLSNHLQYIYYSFTTDYSSSTGYFGTKDNEYYALVSVYRYCEEFTIHDGCVLISEDVFHFCDDLKTVTIPNSVKYIDSYAFYYSDSLNTIYYYGTEEEWNSFDLSLKNVNVIFK